MKCDSVPLISAQVLFAAACAAARRPNGARRRLVRQRRPLARRVMEPEVGMPVTVPGCPTCQCTCRASALMPAGMRPGFDLLGGEWVHVPPHVRGASLPVAARVPVRPSLRARLRASAGPGLYRVLVSVTGTVAARAHAAPPHSTRRSLRSPMRSTRRAGAPRRYAFRLQVVQQDYGAPIRCISLDPR